MLYCCSTGLPVPAVIISAAVSNEHYGLEHDNEIIAYVCIDNVSGKTGLIAHDRLFTSNTVLHE